MGPITDQIKKLVTARHYPCIAAVQSFYSGAYQVGHYSTLGSGQHASDLGIELEKFITQYKKDPIPFFSFWAIYPDTPPFKDGLEFEKALWQELSLLADFDNSGLGWDPQFSSDPEDRDFCFSYHGHAFFVVGLHPNSPRKARQFPYPTLIFNLYSQFSELMEKNEFQPMVQKNREREKLYQGDLNPMVVQYSENWEAIQFSGEQNSPNWKCPFQSKLKNNSQE